MPTAPNNGMQAEPPSEDDEERRFAETLKRVLATPPDHKTKHSASPKKRGRPPKRPNKT